MPVVMLLPRDHYYTKTLGNLKEVEARGGNIVIVTDEPDESMAPESTLVVPRVPYHLAPVVMTIPLQLLAYHIAVHGARMWTSRATSPRASPWSRRTARLTRGGAPWDRPTLRSRFPLRRPETLGHHVDLRRPLARGAGPHPPHGVEMVGHLFQQRLQVGAGKGLEQEPAAAPQQQPGDAEGPAGQLQARVRSASRDARKARRHVGEDAIRGPAGVAADLFHRFLRHHVQHERLHLRPRKGLYRLQVESQHPSPRAASSAATWSHRPVPRRGPPPLGRSQSPGTVGDLQQLVRRPGAVTLTLGLAEIPVCGRYDMRHASYLMAPPMPTDLTSQFWHL